MPLLPPVVDLGDYRKVYSRDATWLPAMRVLCQRHGLPAAQLRRAVLGSNPVFHAGDRVIKLFPPFEAEHVSELAGLRAAANLSVAVPHVVHNGELEGWAYAVLSCVSGTPAIDVWAELTPQQRHDISRQIGRLLAELHACAIPEDLPRDWEAFLQARIAGAVEHHGEGEPWRSWIARRVGTFTPSRRDLVLLHADITEDHVLLERRGDGWRIASLIDFGDARVGHPFYDLLAPMCFYAFGDPPATRALLEGFGLEATPAIRDELVTWCLLHEFGTVGSFTERCPVADGAAFARALWGGDGP